ncbi:hypothetical protein RB595_000842 [Gaeumannomyces hyphopodioides]
MADGFWTKWWVFFCLIIPTATSITLLVAEAETWVFSSPASDFIQKNRATTQLVVQVLSTLLALVQSLAVCRLIKYGGILRLASRPRMTTRQLRGWGNMATAKIDTNVSFLHLVLAIAVACISIALSAVWTGAMTPVQVTLTTESNITIPTFGNTSLIQEYPSEVEASGPEIQTRQGMFSYSVGIKNIGALISSAASATSADGSVRKHAKFDNTQFAYTGRSYGAGSAVGLKDEKTRAGLRGRAVSYRYNETGYEAVVGCTRNASTAFAIRGQVLQRVFPVVGRMPDSDTDEYSEYFGHSSGHIVALGVAVGRAKRYVSVAAGRTYRALNATQCTVDFVPARFSVNVSLADRNISVTKIEGGRGGAGAGAVLDMDPERNLTRVLMRQFQIISNDLTNLYESVLGDALLASVAAWNSSNNAAGTVPEERATLAGVENALVAMTDDMLVLYAAAQLMVGNFSQPAAVTVASAVLKVGKREFAWAIAALNAAIVVAVLVEAVRTRGWGRLPSFDFTDLEWLMLASFRGGAMSAGEETSPMSSQHRGFKRNLNSPLIHERPVETDAWEVGKGDEDVIVELIQLDEQGQDTVLVMRGGDA